MLTTASSTSWRSNLLEVWETPDIGTSNIWQAHHIIPQAQSGDLHQLVRPAQQALDHFGINIHSPANLVWLPTNDEALELIRATRKLDTLPLTHLGSGLHNTVNIPGGQSILPVRNVTNQLVDLRRARGKTEEAVELLYKMANSCLQGDYP